MKFTELDNRMRIFETASDQCVLPGIYMVARIDGRHFHTLTKESGNFVAPFDEKFRDLMIGTVEHLMKNSGFSFIYGYTESDEISLLFSLETQDFGRKLRKLNSILAGEASAKFSLLYGDMGVFDCRISQLPRKEDVIDYFRWRNEDACRNALNAWCYWTLRKEGLGRKEATDGLSKLGTDAKNELLHGLGKNFNDLPLWQKRGIGFYWETYEKEGAFRRRLKIDMELPLKDKYSDFICEILEWEKVNRLSAIEAFELFLKKRGIKLDYKIDSEDKNVTILESEEFQISLHEENNEYVKIYFNFKSTKEGTNSDEFEGMGLGSHKWLVNRINGEETEIIENTL